MNQYWDKEKETLEREELLEYQKSQLVKTLEIAWEMIRMEYLVTMVCFARSQTHASRAFVKV